MSGKKYLYNGYIANEMLKWGYTPVEIGFNPNSQKMFVAFKYSEYEVFNKEFNKDKIQDNNGFYHK